MEIFLLICFCGAARFIATFGWVPIGNSTLFYFMSFLWLSYGLQPLGAVPLSSPEVQWYIYCTHLSHRWWFISFPIHGELPSCLPHHIAESFHSIAQNVLSWNAIYMKKLGEAFVSINVSKKMSSAVKENDCNLYLIEREDWDRVQKGEKNLISQNSEVHGGKMRSMSQHQEGKNKMNERKTGFEAVMGEGLFLSDGCSLGN